MIREELPVFRRLKPNLVSILIGVNDLVQGRSPDAYRQSLHSIYQEIVVGSDVFALSIPTWSYTPAAASFGGAEHVSRLTRIFNQVAREEAAYVGFNWIDLGPVSESRIGSAGWLADDDLHPGDAQYAAWAEVISGALLSRWPELASR